MNNEGVDVKNLPTTIAEAMRDRDEYAEQAALYHADMMKVREQRDKAREMFAAAESLRLQGNDVNARLASELVSERETLSALADCYVEMKAHAKVLHEALADFAARSTTTAPTTLVREAQRILAKTPKHWVAEQGEVFAHAGSTHGKTAPELPVDAMRADLRKEEGAVLERAKAIADTHAEVKLWDLQRHANAMASLLQSLADNGYEFHSPANCDLVDALLAAHAARGSAKS